MSVISVLLQLILAAYHAKKGSQVAWVFQMVTMQYLAKNILHITWIAISTEQ